MNQTLPLHFPQFWSNLVVFLNPGSVRVWLIYRNVSTGKYIDFTFTCFIYNTTSSIEIIHHGHMKGHILWDRIWVSMEKLCSLSPIQISFGFLRDVLLNYPNNSPYLWKCQDKWCWQYISQFFCWVVMIKNRSTIGTMQLFHVLQTKVVITP